MIKGEVKSEPAVRLESITKEESADVERKLKMDRTMSAVLLSSSFRVPPCRPTDPLLHTGRNPHRHGDETPGAAGGGLGLELFDQGGAQLPVPRDGAAPVLLAGAPFRARTIVLFLTLQTFDSQLFPAGRIHKHANRCSSTRSPTNLSIWPGSPWASHPSKSLGTSPLPPPLSSLSPSAEARQCVVTLILLYSLQAPGLHGRAQGRQGAAAKHHADRGRLLARYQTSTRPR